MSDKIYQIRKSQDDMYSTGSTEPKFTKTGKAWTSLGALKSHITMINSLYESAAEHPYHDCIIVTYEINWVASTEMHNYHTLEK